MRNLNTKFGGVEGRMLPNGIMSYGYRFDVGGPDDPNVILADIAAGRRTDDPYECFRYPYPTDCVAGRRTGSSQAVVNTQVVNNAVQAVASVTQATLPAPAVTPSTNPVQTLTATASNLAATVQNKLTANPLLSVAAIALIIYFASKK